MRHDNNFRKKLIQTILKKKYGGNKTDGRTLAFLQNLKLGELISLAEYEEDEDCVKQEILEDNYCNNLRY